MSALAVVFSLTLVAEGHPLIQPVPDSVLVVASDAKDDDMIVVYREDNRRTRKTVYGRYWRLEYDVQGDPLRYHRPLRCRERSPPWCDPSRGRKPHDVHRDEGRRR